MLCVNNWGANMAIQSLLTGLRIYASSSLFGLTVTAGRMRWLIVVKPIFIGIGAEGSDLQVRKSNIIRGRHVVETVFGNWTKALCRTTNR